MAENKPVLISLVVVAVLLVGAVGYYFATSEPETVVSQPAPVPAPAPEPLPPPESEPEPETPPLPAAEVVPAALPEPEAEPEPPPEPAFVLPRLDDSDQLVRDAVASLTRHAGLAEWLTVSELVRRFTVTVDNLSRGLVPREQISMLGPDAPFPAEPTGEDGVFLLDERGYERYDRFTEVFTSIDARRAAEFYDLVRPLLNEAYRELGYQNTHFDDVVFRAIGRLLETPTLSGPIRLRRPVVMYEFEDPDLERLSAAQKQLIRMGPRNTRAIRAKLSAFALELRSLPRR